MRVVRQMKHMSSYVWGRLKNDRRGVLGEVLAIIASVIIAAFIFIPQLRSFATSIMSGLTTWWESVKNNIFSNA